MPHPSKKGSKKRHADEPDGFDPIAESTSNSSGDSARSSSSKRQTRSQTRASESQASESQASESQASEAQANLQVPGTSEGSSAGPSRSRSPSRMDFDDSLTDDEIFNKIIAELEKAAAGTRGDQRTSGRSRDGQGTSTRSRDSSSSRAEPLQIDKVSEEHLKELRRVFNVARKKEVKASYEQLSDAVNLRWTELKKEEEKARKKMLAENAKIADTVGETPADVSQLKGKPRKFT